MTGSGIDGDTSRHIANGDFLMVPENTAHGFTETDGTLFVMSLHVPVAARHAEGPRRD